jgi:sulfite dehydrogenase (quinone) subunit SoeC
MNPALSVIFFTTASGAGYGMLVVVGVYAMMGRLPQSLWFSLTTMVIALGLITAGLLSSTFHLGHPERAWRAFSQWRTSWLSREGIMAVATYFPALGFGLAWMFPAIIPLPLGLLGIVMALFALGTIYTTAMIYRSLKPIHQWHNKHVVPGYLILGVMTGAVFVLALSALFAQPMHFLAPISGILLAAGLTAKWLYWSFIDSTAGISTPASAVGLSGPDVKVTSIEWPHTEANYVLKEMGFQVARKHAARLRAIAIWAGFLLPAITLEATILLPGGMLVLLAVPAALIMALGIVAERWLFFAQAKHSVTLYYGAQSA